MPASISIGPHPRFLDPSGSWVASTIGGVSFETDSKGSPTRNVNHSPQRLNDELVSSCKIVELCDSDSIFRANPYLTPTKSTQVVQPPQHSDRTSRTSSATTHSTVKELGSHRYQPQPQPQELTEKQLQQQRHVMKLRELGEKHMQPEPSEIKTSKKKKGKATGLPTCPTTR